MMEGSGEAGATLAYLRHNFQNMKAATGAGGAKCGMPVRDLRERSTSGVVGVTSGGGKDSGGKGGGGGVVGVGQL